MKVHRLVMIALMIVGIFSLFAVSGNAAESGNAINQGTSFQDHRDGTYGPAGSGGYGLPDMKKTVGPDEVEDKTTERKPIFQNIFQGTSFQNHSQGKYGPEGAGGYGSPVPEKTDETDIKAKNN